MACFITVRAFDVKDNVPFLWSRAVSHKPAIESTPFSDMITKRTVWSEQTASIMLQPWIICVCTHIYMPKHLISLIIQCTKGIVSKWGVRDEKFASGLCFVVCFGGLFRRSVSGYVSGVCFTKVELPSLTWSWSPQKKYKPIYIPVSTTSIQQKIPQLLHIFYGFPACSPAISTVKTQGTALLRRVAPLHEQQECSSPGPWQPWRW